MWINCVLVRRFICDSKRNKKFHRYFCALNLRNGKQFDWCATNCLNVQIDFCGESFLHSSNRAQSCIFSVENSVRGHFASSESISILKKKNISRAIIACSFSPFSEIISFRSINVFFCDLFYFMSCRLFGHFQMFKTFFDDFDSSYFIDKTKTMSWNGRDMKNTRKTCCIV